MPMPNVKSSGLIKTPESVGAVTVSTIDPVIPFRVAEMVVVPAPLAVADPVALMAAVANAEEFQVTRVLISALLPSS